MLGKDLSENLVEFGIIKSIENINSLIKDIYKETHETTMRH